VRPLAVTETKLVPTTPALVVVNGAMKVEEVEVEGEKVKKFAPVIVRTVLCSASLTATKKVIRTSVAPTAPAMKKDVINAASIC